MKKFTLALLLVFVLSACAPVQTSNAVQLPEVIQLAVGIGILALVTYGLKFVFELSGLDLRGFGTAVAATVSAFVIAQLQGVIDAIPAAYDPTITVVLQIVVVILGGLGVLKIMARDTHAKAI